LTEILLAQVISCSTTKEFWRSLEEYYSSTSRASLHELKRQIQTANKGDLSCSDYLLHLRRVFDELAFIGAPLPEEELVSATINGLGIQYNSIVAVVSTAYCHGAFSFSDLRGLLLSHEALLKSQAFSNSTTFYAGRSGSSRYHQNSTHFSPSTCYL
jgi:gag-polypeptide of LTR copia-type